MTLSLFDENEAPKKWQTEWQDMPEYKLKAKTYFSEIVFRFDNKEDLDAFSQLIGQKLTIKTKWAYFPQKKNVSTDINIIYTDES